MTGRTLMCPAQCGRRRRVAQLLCRPCWNRLPTRIRADLYRCWQASERNLSDDPTWNRYLQAKRVAVYHLRRTRAAAPR